MKILLRVLRFSIIALTVIVLGGVFWLRDRYVVPIITYHNVAESRLAAGASYQELNNVTPKSFAYQMKFLKDKGYKVISFDELVSGIKAARVFPRNTVVIHFDDGYEDNYTNAFPVLKSYGFPAMVFLVSDLIGVKGEYLTWDQVKEMDAHGFKAGAHTRRHAYLPDLNADQIKDQLAGSKRIIEEKLGHPIDYLVYPSGAFNEMTKQIAKESGFKAAATTNRGFDRSNRDLFEIKRIRIKDTDRGFALWAKLSGYYNLFRKSKAGS